MRAPSWWENRGIVSTALLPIAWIYAAIAASKRRRAKPAPNPVPVICVGNLVAGGAGKTPTCLALAELAQEAGIAAHFLTRGYGGSLTGPVRADPQSQDYRAVGDEALLLAEALPCWVSRDRPAGVMAAAKAGAKLVIMDDGLQNLSIKPDFSILVIDGGYGFGNERPIPAGPLRESWAAARPRIDAVVMIGADRHGLASRLDGMPVIAARLKPAGSIDLESRKLLPFAGIGRPEKFFNTLREMGADLQAPKSFPDHHPYTGGDIAALKSRAAALGATPITTAKDFVRIPPSERPDIEVLPVNLVWDDAAAITKSMWALLSPYLKGLKY